MKLDVERLLDRAQREHLLEGATVFRFRLRFSRETDFTNLEKQLADTVWFSRRTYKSD